VLDRVTVSLESRFNAQSLTVVKHISAMLKADDSFDSAVNAVSETDGDVCL